MLLGSSEPEQFEVSLTNICQTITNDMFWRHEMFLKEQKVNVGQVYAHRVDIQLQPDWSLAAGWTLVNLISSGIIVIGIS